MIRNLKIARDTAVKSRSQATVALKTLINNAPADLLETLDQFKGKVGLIRHIAVFRPGDIDTPVASAKAAMRALAVVGDGFMKKLLHTIKNWNDL